MQVEIDERVTRLAEQYFPELCESNGDPRAELLFIDGIKYMAECEPESLDLVIVDSTDPVGPAEGLFNAAFYASCYKALRHGGLLVQQSESPLAHLELIKSMRSAMRTSGFSAVRTLPFPQPCYPTGWWSCTMARKGGDLSGFRERGAHQQELPHPLLQRRHPQGRAGAAGIHARSAGRIGGKGRGQQIHARRPRLLPRSEHL